MKRHFLFLVLPLIAFWAASVAVAAAAEKGCSLQGSWINIDEQGMPGWVFTASGQSESFGSNTLEYPFEFPALPTSLDPTDDPPFSPIFPNAVGMTQMRGIWKRTGGNTFDYTMIGYGYDEYGLPIYVNKMSGTLILGEDCNEADVSVTLKIFTCDYTQEPICTNPLTGTPDIVFSDVPNSIGYRLMLE